MPTPREFEGVKPRKTWLTVKRGFMRRSGQDGQVVCVHDDGVSLDFYTCGKCGAAKCSCYASIEHWKWDELEPLND